MRNKESLNLFLLKEGERIMQAFPRLPVFLVDHLVNAIVRRGTVVYNWYRYDFGNNRKWEDVLRTAALAHLRHTCTDYEDLMLQKKVFKMQARNMIEKEMKGFEEYFK